MSDDDDSCAQLEDAWSSASDIDEDALKEDYSEPEELFPRLRNLKDSPDTKRLKMNGPETNGDDQDDLSICFKCNKQVFIYNNYRNKNYCVDCFKLVNGSTTSKTIKKPMCKSLLDSKYFKGAVVMDVSNDLNIPLAKF